MPRRILFKLCIITAYGPSGLCSRQILPLVLSRSFFYQRLPLATSWVDSTPLYTRAHYRRHMGSSSCPGTGFLLFPSPLSALLSVAPPLLQHIVPAPDHLVHPVETSSRPNPPDPRRARSSYRSFFRSYIYSNLVIHARQICCRVFHTQRIVGLPVIIGLELVLGIVRLGIQPFLTA